MGIALMLFKCVGACVSVCSLTLSWLTGDFAVLLKAGMTVKQAIVYNLLSALMAYIGMVIGIAVGQYTNNVTSWIFAITAGMFLYVALVDMVSWHVTLDSPRATIVPYKASAYLPLSGLPRRQSVHFSLSPNRQ